MGFPEAFLILFPLDNARKIIDNASNRKETKVNEPPIVSIPRDLYLEERRQLILDRLDRQGRVSVAELSRAFGVSEATIRVDLQALADQQIVVRTHGGAVLASGRLYELALATRRLQHVAEKGEIGAAGAALVVEGDAIFLDSSSTALAVAQRLKQHRRVTVLTNALAVAQELGDAAGPSLARPSGVTVVVIGGRLERETQSLIGSEGVEALRKYNIQKGFFGAHGIAVPEGLTDISAEEADFKRPVVAMCRQVIAVLDSSKWGQVGLASFARIEDIDTILTNAGAPAGLVTQVQDQGVDVRLV
jgi:DeoR/GlpR family transcriptional regulator of sugar metabolism